MNLNEFSISNEHLFFQHEKKLTKILNHQEFFFPLGEEFLKNFSHEWIIIIDWINCGREKMRNDGLNTPHHKFPNNPLDIFSKKIFYPWKDWIIMHFLSHENTFCPTKTASKMNKSYAPCDLTLPREHSEEFGIKSVKKLKCSRSVCMWLFFELWIGDNRQPVFFYDGGKWNIITNLLQF